jgi:hypothetical protein
MRACGTGRKFAEYDQRVSVFSESWQTLTDGQLSYVHAYGSKHFSHRLFSAHVVISCAYGSYRLREFDYCANLNIIII